MENYLVETDWNVRDGLFTAIEKLLRLTTDLLLPPPRGKGVRGMFPAWRGKWIERSLNPSMGMGLRVTEIICTGHRGRRQSNVIWEV